MNIIIQKDVEAIVKDGMMNYSKYVLLDRALPDVRDGLKPVQRRILITMDNMKAHNLTKSANVTGQVMKLHPHGDSYGTIVGMVQADKQNSPLLIGKGSFAQHTSRDMQAAASRYTEVKLSEMAKEMLNNLKKGMVEIIPNYDGTMKMPKILPVKFPVVLTQASSGIGVGFASMIPSFNLIELTNAMTKYINTGEKTYLYPDFATGGLIDIDEEAIKQINENGNGAVKLRGKAEIVGNEIVVTEIPYTTTREVIIEKITELAKAKKLPEITDVKDLTGLSGMKFVIKTRKNTNMQLLLDKLFKLTKLEDKFNANMNMLVNDLPKVAGVWETIEHWLIWRKQCVIQGLRYDTNKMKEQLHLLKGLEKVLLDIDSAIEIIRSTHEDEIVSALMKKYSIDEIQAEDVADMKLRYINRGYILKKVAEIEGLEKKIAINEKAMSSDVMLNKIIIKGLQETAEKYGTERKTKLVQMNEIPAIKFEPETVADYDVIVKLTKEGYVYKFKGEKELTLKAGDEIVNEFETQNSAELLVFTKNGDCHKVKLNDISETKANAFGTYLPTIMNDSDIVGYSILDKKQKFIVNVFENKKVAKIDLKSFSGNRKKLKNSLNVNSPLIGILTYSNEGTFNLTTNRYAIECQTSDFNTTATRSAQGAYATTRKGEVIKVEKV